MATNKFFKSILLNLTIAISLFGFCIQDSLAYPVFAQQGYANPRAANGKLACANCHLNQKAIEIEAPQAVLPNSVFEIGLKVPYDVNRQQVSAAGKKADLNVGGIVILPKGFKLATGSQVPKEVKAKSKGVFISPYSTEFDNILVVASPRLDFMACSNGAKALVSSIKSPKLLSSSSPTGFSNETGSFEIFKTFLTLSSGILSF